MSDRVQLNLRLDKYPTLYEEIKTRAKQENLSINDFTLNVLRQGLGWGVEKTPSAEALERVSKLENHLIEINQRLQEVERRMGEESA
jgi:hypothetical protein